MHAFVSGGSEAISFNEVCSLIAGRKPTQRPCTQTEYKCGNGNCISQHYVCDNVDDCGDLSDENGCSK